MKGVFVLDFLHVFHVLLVNIYLVVQTELVLATTVAAGPILLDELRDDDELSAYGECVRFWDRRTYRGEAVEYLRVKLNSLLQLSLWNHVYQPPETGVAEELGQQQREDAEGFLYGVAKLGDVLWLYHHRTLERLQRAF